MTQQPSGGARVEFRGIAKRYGPSMPTRAAEHADDRKRRDDDRGSWALRELTLAVPAGAICALVGPSGGGKTTALKMVNRLIEPTAGQILIDDRDVSTIEPTSLRRRIGYVIQQIGLFPHQTVAENVATVPRLLGWPRSRTGSRVTELIELVGLDPRRYADRYPSELSGGERQRVGVARALAAEPPVMLMDEPFAAVDPIVRERLQDEFLRIHERIRMTVLFVTHDIDEAIKMGDRVAVLEAGRLVQYATPSDLLDRPVNDFVARFVGADRGLKRLSLVTVGELRLRAAPTLRDGSVVEVTAEDARREPFVLLVDEAGRPEGWVNVDRARGKRASRDIADPSSPLFVRDTRVRDALSLLLASGVRTGIVVDEGGRYVGVLGLDDIVPLLGGGSARLDA